MSQLLEELDVVHDPDTDAVDFDVVMRGYDRDQVRERVLALAGDLEAAEEARLRSMGEAGALREELAAVRARLSGEAAPTYADLGERVTSILQLAADEAGRLREEARAEAEALLREAREEADELAAAAHAEEDAAAARREQARTEHEEDLAAEREQLRRETEETLTRTSEEADDIRARSEDEVRALARRRDMIASQLAELQDRVAQAVAAFAGAAGAAAWQAAGVAESEGLEADALAGSLRDHDVDLDDRDDLDDADVDRADLDRADLDRADLDERDGYEADPDAGRRGSSARTVVIDDLDSDEEPDEDAGRARVAAPEGTDRVLRLDPAVDGGGPATIRLEADRADLRG